MKLIGIRRNKRFANKGFKLVLDSDNNIFFDIKYYLNYFNINIILNYFNNLKPKVAPVAQLDRALGYGPGGSGFKS